MTLAGSCVLLGVLALLLSRAARPVLHRTATRDRRLLLALVVTAGGTGLMTMVSSPYSVGVVLILGGSLADLLRRWTRGRRRREAAARRVRLVVACESLAADLRAGLPPRRALVALAARDPEFLRVARAADVGANVPASFTAVSLQPGAARAAALGAAWQVAEQSGAGLANTLMGVARALRAETATAVLIESEIASARSTAVLLAVLPVGIVAAGAGLGGDPWSFLLGTPAGLGCLAVGLGLIHGGLAWMDRIAQPENP